MARVSLEGVSKVFPGGVQAIRSLDLAVEPGELLVLLGPSGSGKSTLLRLIAGLETPTTGTIHIAGCEVSRKPPQQRDVAFVPQSCPLFSHLNVYDNIAFNWRMKHGQQWVSRVWRNVVRSGTLGVAAADEESSRVQAAAKRLGIGHLLERWPRQLSGGERQRVALARAVVREPAAFLFDEPLSGLDVHLRTQLRHDLGQLVRSQSAAAVYVTHDQAEALTLGDRVAVLDAGWLQQVGSPRELYDKPQNRFVARFVGYPPLNVVSGTWRDGVFASPVWGAVETPRAPRDGLVAGRRIELGFRPEAVLLSDGEGRMGQSECGSDGFAEVAAVETTGERDWVCLQPCRVGCGEIETEQPAAAGVTVTPESIIAPAIAGRWQPGQRVCWRLQLPGVHFFDGETGVRLA